MGNVIEIVPNLFEMRRRSTEQYYDPLKVRIMDRADELAGRREREISDIEAISASMMLAFERGDGLAVTRCANALLEIALWTNNDQTRKDIRRALYVTLRETIFILPGPTDISDRYSACLYEPI